MNLLPEQRDAIGLCLGKLRTNLANGKFLRDKFYTDDRSKLAGNTHHYWLRLGVDPDSGSTFKDFLPKDMPEPIASCLEGELKRKIFNRLPKEYSTLIKIPFSVPIEEVGDERSKTIKQTIERRLATVTPYAIFYHQINRILKSLGVEKSPPSESEIDLLLTRYSKCSIAKARQLFPEVWDEVRGYYVLDSRGAPFAKRLVKELESRNLLSGTTKFVDLGSGVGTNLFAVNFYSNIHATGIELHPEIFKLSEIANRRLAKIGILDAKRIKLQHGNAFDSKVVNIADFDVIYVYSSLGKSEIDIDEVFDRAGPNAVIIFNQLPTGNLEDISKPKIVRSS
jgi:SAM-dependent methyltransferase